MKRIALALAVVVMAAGACKKAQQSNTAAPPADSKMADSMKMMAPADTTHRMADTSKMHAAPPPAPAPATKPKARRP
jgi:hypothetical protein